MWVSVDTMEFPLHCLLLAAAGCGCSGATLSATPPQPLQPEVESALSLRWGPKLRAATAEGPEPDHAAPLHAARLALNVERVLVLCRARWCDDRLLRGLDVPVVVLVEPGASWTESRALQLTPSNLSVVLVAADDLGQLAGARPLLATVMPLTLTLLWVSAPPRATRAELEAAVDAATSTSTIGMKLASVRLGVSWDGHARLYSWNTSTVALTQVDAWSPGAGWRRDAPVLAAGCNPWRPRPRPPGAGGQALVFFNQVQRGLSPEVSARLSRLSDLVLEGLRNAGLSLRRERTFQEHFPEAIRRADACQVDLWTMPYVMNSRMMDALEPFVCRALNVYVAVPAGAGLGRTSLHRLSIFSKELKLATTAAALIVFIALCALCRPGAGPGAGPGRAAPARSALREALQTMAPLLGQPLPFAHGRPQRPLLAAWLAVCVVLVAAYQGKLLGRLTVPDAADEINSMEQLAASGLPVYTKWDFLSVDWPASVQQLLQPYDGSPAEFVQDALRHRRRVAVILEKNVLDILPPQASKSHGFCCAQLKKFCTSQNSEKSGKTIELFPIGLTVLIGPLQDRRELHVFPVTKVRLVKCMFVTSRGSPVEAPLRAVVGRVHAGGLFHIRSSRLPRAGSAPPLALVGLSVLVALMGRGHEEQDRERTLVLGLILQALEHLEPAFIVLAAGLGLAALAFLVELICARVPPI
ncbi:Glutamate receptor 3.6 [Frankliniella fusca]|uniref:Glutamate receptor 3.6 n=1 Tax=Frankliniella fusca TaxID=407009 RepID=A0AAE1HBE8_9NEOP|nr:Glutamate receptor 3.6 [Frankliniella fusca]